ncbi:MAG: TonB-dependent receptor [Proteobacteria bacterium]|nr:TonB-dependent receptor [Pseudomonadota bacterium]
MTSGKLRRSTFLATAFAVSARTLCVFFNLLPFAMAQVQESAPSQLSDGALVIEEIIVTAQKRERAAQDVPISMTVFTDKALEALNLSDVAEIARYTPNLEWDPSWLGASNNSSIFIRGVGQAANFAEHSTDPAVGLYLDGVYIARGVGSVMGVLDVSRVEILRGPQGTLFGKNATGGAITMITIRPTDAFSGWVDVTTGSDNRADLRLVVNLPLTDQVLTRFSVSSFNRDGYGVSMQDSTVFGDINTDYARGTLRWLPRENLTVDFIADRTRSRQGSPVISPVFIEPGPMSLAGAYNFFVAPANTVPGFGDGVFFDSRFITPSNFTNYSTGESGSDLDAQGLTAIVDWRPRDLIFTSITAYRDMESLWAVDVDGSPLTIIEDILGLDQHQFSQEFNLRGRSGPLDWLLGLYYFEEEATASGGAIVIPDLAMIEFDPLFGVPNPLFGVPLSLGIQPIVNVHRATSVAIFSHLEYAFTERLTGSAGVRFTDEEKRVSNPPGVAPVASNGNSSSFTNLSPMLGLQYFVDQHLHIYGSVSQGFRSGGFNTLVLLPRQDYLPFDPEKATSYEVGVKASGGRFMVSGAAFFVDYDDIQISVLNDFEPQILNAAEAEIKGVEVELAAALTSGLKLQAGIGYLDAKYVKLDPLGLQGLTVPITLDTKLMNTPEWSINLGLSYSTQLRHLGRLVIRGDYSWRDKSYKDAINTEELFQDAYGLLHAGATLVSNDSRWQFTLFGDNLTNEQYIQSGVAGKPLFGLVAATVAHPRTWGLSVQYRFSSEASGDH